MAARLARSANPTRGRVKGGTGERDVGGRLKAAAQPLVTVSPIQKIRLGQHVVLPYLTTNSGSPPLDRWSSVGIPTAHDATAHLDSPEEAPDSRL